VGREPELAQLHHWWENALSGERQIVFVTGEPGIGKTALVEAFVASTGSSAKFRVSSSTRRSFRPQSSVLSTQSSNSPTPSTQAEAEAEACFHKAIDIARRQQAKSRELRAVISLSRLWQSQSKKAEARQMLAEIYGWFTEGFDPADLQDAKTLLEELQR
jgi:Cdc6-like AAA superfamily ATPase